MNSRAKGGRTFRKAVAYAKTKYPNGYIMPIYQVSMWAQPQPCDMIIFDPYSVPILVEVRSNQWGINKPQTVKLSKLPNCVRQIWMFKDGENEPKIRNCIGEKWK